MQGQSNPNGRGLAGGFGQVRPKPGTRGIAAGRGDGSRRFVEEVIGCPDCGLIQKLPGNPGNGNLQCSRCGRILERMNGRSLDGALACSFTTFLLLFPANLLPLLQVDILSAQNHSVIASSILGIWSQNWPLVAIVIGLEIVVVPFLRFGLLTASLLAIRLGSDNAWIGPAFRWAEWLDQWAMIDVFLFGGIIGYSRVAAVLPIHVEKGGYCLIAAAFLTLVTRASLERRELWRRIGPVVTEQKPNMIACTECDFPVGEEAQGRPCPRCGARIWRCHPFSPMRAIALVAAASAFYPLAYIFPMEYNDQLGNLVGFTIMTGVMKLVQANFLFFAAVVFTASIIIPLLKLFTFAWFGVSIYRGSSGMLRFKSRLFRIISVIGRWSHIDPFTVAVFLPIMRLQGFLSVEVGRALPAFLAVVVLTMMATQLFDPRALWLAGRRAR